MPAWIVLCTLILLLALLPAPLMAQTIPFTTDAGDIVGGQPTEPGEYPWQAFLLIGNRVCGGVLIQPRWVLTAAHCVWIDDATGQVAPGDVTVFLGKHDISRFEPTEQALGVTQVVVHPTYSDFSSDGDLALLQLTTPAVLTARVSTLALTGSPDDDPLVVPTIGAVATGWGATDEDSDFLSRLLREVTLPLVSNDVCQSTMPFFSITANHLCAGVAAGGIDSCFGDSGGPLIVPNPQGGWKLAGITSFGVGCARPNTYGVYTRVARYLDWVNAYVRPTKINSFTPTAGRVGTLVTIQGEGFQDTTAVQFGDAFAAFAVLSDSELSAVVPPPAKTGPLAITTASTTVRSSSNFQVNNLLALRLVGPALGTLIASPYACSRTAQCDLDFPNGTAVMVSAQDTDDAYFIGWQAGCTGIFPTCALILDSDKTVQARFAPPTSTVTVAVFGAGGRVTDPAGSLDCGITCRAVAPTRSTISLTAVPDAGFMLTGWGGACRGRSPVCTPALYGDQQVTADFAAATTPLTVTLRGPGSGTVREQWGALDCPANCSTQFAPGMEVALIATPAPGSIFARWEGDCIGTGDTCSLVITEATTVTAHFTTGWRLRLPALLNTRFDGG
jgi:secreted trypsin-like serine protease